MLNDDLRATRRFTGAMGLATAILFAVGNALWAFDQPVAGASASEITAFYEDNATNIAIGGTLSLVSIGCFAFFASGMRTLLRAFARDDVLPNAAFGGAIILLSTGLGAETINLAAALRADDGALGGELASALFEVSYALGYYAAGVGIGVFLAAVAGIALQDRVLLPRSLAWVTVAIAVAFCTPLSVYLLAPAVLLLVVVSIMLLRPARSAA